MERIGNEIQTFRKEPCLPKKGMVLGVKLLPVEQRQTSGQVNGRLEGYYPNYDDISIFLTPPSHQGRYPQRSSYFEPHASIHTYCSTIPQDPPIWPA